MTFLFGTGIESSYPTVADGRRVDLLDSCGHYARWEEDFEILRELGVRALHYGPAYYRTHVAPDRFDWDTCEEPMRRLRMLGIEVIADLCHFGVPSWLEGFQDPAFPVLFAGYARAFARRFPWVRYFTPVHEIFTCAVNSALRGYWNECMTGDAAFVRALKHLCLAHELAVEAILSERPDAVIVQREGARHWHPTEPAAQAEADRWNALKLLALDLTTGHEPVPGMAAYLHAHGVTSNELSFFREKRAVGQRWLSLDIYRAGEHRVDVGGTWSPSPKPLGARALLAAYYERYRAPLYYTAMGHSSPAGAPLPTTPEGSDAVARWLTDQWEELLAVRTTGVPICGFAWHSLTHQVGWSRSPHESVGAERAVGLVDLNRELSPTGAAFEALIRRWSLVLDVRACMAPHPPRLEVVRG